MSQFDNSDLVYDKAETVTSESKSDWGNPIDQIKRLFSKAASTGTLVRSVAVFAVSVLLLIFAFCPFVFTVMNVDGREYKLKFNSIDFVKMAVYSVGDYNEGEIMDSSVYKELIKRGYEEGMDHLSYTRREMTPFIKGEVFLEIMRSPSKLKLTSFFAALGAVVYIAFCLLMFAKSAISLIKELYLYFVKKQVSSEKKDRWILRLLAYLIYLPLLRYVLLMCQCQGQGSMESYFSIMRSGSSFGFVFSVIAALAGVVFLFVHKLSNMVLDGELKLDNVKSEIFSLVIALVFLVSVFLPVISADVSYRVNYSNSFVAVFSPETYDLDVKIGYLDLNELSWDEVMYYSNNTYDASCDMIYKELLNLYSSGKEPSFERTLHHRILIGCGRVDLSAMYIVMFIINMLTLAMLATLVMRLVKKSIFSIDVGRVRLFKVLLFMTSITQCVLIFIMCIIMNESLGMAENFAINLEIGLGAVLPVICSFAMLLLKDRRDELEATIDKYYDNSDVSYAPYVVGYKSK